MNDISELMSYGITEGTAKKMIAEFSKHIGQVNGDYTITDVTYIGNRARKVKEICNYCHTEIEREMIPGRNKWSELQRTCDCRKERILQEKQAKKEKEKENRLLTRITEMDSYIGTHLGEYTIKSRIGNKYLLFSCDICGKEKKMYYDSIDFGNGAKYICRSHRKQEEVYTEDYIGRKYKMLTITGITKDIKNKKAFLCKCDCGKYIVIKPALLVNGKYRSCGCYLETRSLGAEQRKRIKGIYNGMRHRCLNKNAKDYKLYGGRGIKICEEWLNDFEKFYQWSMENGYDNRLTIDRIDSNGNYSPDNCRWTTWDIQCRNKRQRQKEVNLCVADRH